MFYLFLSVQQLALRRGLSNGWTSLEPKTYFDLPLPAFSPPSCPLELCVVSQLCCPHARPVPGACTPALSLRKDVGALCVLMVGLLSSLWLLPLFNHSCRPVCISASQGVLHRAAPPYPAVPGCIHTHRACKEGLLTRVSWLLSPLPLCVWDIGCQHPAKLCLC